MIITNPIYGHAPKGTTITCIGCGSIFPMNTKKEYEFIFNSKDDGLFNEFNNFEYLINLNENCPSCGMYLQNVGIPAENVFFEELRWYEAI